MPYSVTWGVTALFDKSQGTNYAANYSLKGLILSTIFGALLGGLGGKSHGGLSPHVHQPQRNVAPNGNIYGSVGTKTINGGVTSPSPKDASQLYDYIYNGKYH